MAAQSKGSKSEAAVDAAASAPKSTEAKPAAKSPTGGDPEPTSAPETDPAPQLIEPVRRYQVGTPEPFRAGGHVLTERGWEIDPEALEAARQQTPQTPEQES